jgi:multidrug resistance efflux pump
MSRQIVLSLILIAVLLVSSVGIFIVLVMNKPSPPRTEVEEPVLLVQTVEVQPATVIEPIIGFGTARADRFARLASQVAGEIIELPDELKPGVEVQEGQTLLQIDPRQYQRQLERARGALVATQAQLKTLEVESANIDELIALATKEYEIADREYERVKDLFDRNLAPKREHDLALLAEQARERTLQELQNQKALIPTRRNELEALLQNRQAELALAELDFERCTITAPFAGRVDHVLVDRGDWVGIGTPLVTLLDPGLIEVPIELPVSIRPRVRVGAKCRLSVDSMPEITWDGSVKRISPSASETLRTFELYVEVNNEGQVHQLVPGFFVQARIDGPALENVMIVPRGVVQQGRVFICNDGRAMPRDVRIERHLRDQTVVTGLEPGDLVITSNLDVLHEALPVSPLEASGASSGEPLVQSNGDATVQTK